MDKKKYIESVVVKNVTIRAGNIELTDKQYRLRAATRNLEKIGKGRYKIVGPVTFKAGETFGYLGNSKGLTIRPIAEAKEEQEAARKKSEARAKADIAAWAKAERENIK